MQKQLLLGVEAIAQGAIDSGMYTGHGQPTKRRPWNRLWECLTPAKEPWYV